MNDEWIHLGPMPSATRLRGPDGTESVIPLRSPADGELVARVVTRWDGSPWSPPGAVVEVVAVQEKDELVLGDRLLVYDRAPCGHCEICRRGCATSCPDASRSRVATFEQELVVVPAWIARRGRVRLSRDVSDAAAQALGAHAAILRALVQEAGSNPLRVLVAGNGGAAAFAGRILETLWPDARRILWGRGVDAAGYHRAAATATEIPPRPEPGADLVLVLAPVDGRELAERVAPGARIVVVGEGELANPEPLWRGEVAIRSSQGGLAGDVEAWRRQLDAFSARWVDPG